MLLMLMLTSKHWGKWESGATVAKKFPQVTKRGKWGTAVMAATVWSVLEMP